MLTAFYPNALNIRISRFRPGRRALYVSGKDGCSLGTVLLDQRAMPAMTAFDTAATPIPNVPTNLASDPCFANMPQEVKLLCRSAAFFSTFTSAPADVDWFLSGRRPVDDVDDLPLQLDHVMRVPPEAAAGDGLGEPRAPAGDVRRACPSQGGGLPELLVVWTRSDPPATLLRRSQHLSALTLRLATVKSVRIQSTVRYQGVGVESAADRGLLALHDVTRCGLYADASKSGASTIRAQTAEVTPVAPVNQSTIMLQACHCAAGPGPA